MLNRLSRLALVALLALSPIPAQAVSDIHDYSATAASNTDVNGINIGENMQRAAVNNAIREILAELKRAVANQGSNIASAATTNICATGTSIYAKVTGTTTITSFGTAAAGCWRWIEFTGALTLTHNATSLILPGGANITTAAGDTLAAISEGSGNWRVLTYVKASGVSVVPNSNGVHKLWIPAAAMRPATTSGPASADVTGTGAQYYVLDFDQTTVEIVHFNISMPSSWNEGTVTFVPVWTAASGTGGVTWALNGNAVSNDDAIAVTYSGTATSIDTLIATGDLHRGPESGALTIDGTPAANDTVFFRFRRAPADPSDTLDADARLLGIELYITTDAATDAP